MTDLEMTRLCAEARGLQHHAPRGGMDDDLWAIDYSSDDVPYSFRYDPLHDNAQAMALVKKLRLTVLGSGGYPEYEGWQVMTPDAESTCHADLNRAIVECVAKMQEEKNLGR